MCLDWGLLLVSYAVMLNHSEAFMLCFLYYPSVSVILSFSEGSPTHFVKGRCFTDVQHDK